jgi:hypothetical protein
MCRHGRTPRSPGPWSPPGTPTRTAASPGGREGGPLQQQPAAAPNGLDRVVTGVAAAGFGLAVPMALLGLIASWMD